MDSLYILIPIALVFCGLAIKLLLWAVNNGQYDDLDREASRILMDEPTTSPSPETRQAPPKTDTEKPSRE